MPSSACIKNVAVRWPTRTCIIHVGTHKTGSTAIQHFLASNADELRTHGVLIPVSGRLADSPDGCGHHCIAWDVLGSDASAPIDGSLEQLIEEIRVASMPMVCISSEEFSHMHAVPNNMQRLRQGLSAIGYRPIVVVYLRPQADYLEALYAEVSQHARVRDFGACYREIMKHGAVDFWHAGRFPMLFDYLRFIAPFERIFGKKNVIVRPFRRFASPEQLTSDFLRVLGVASIQVRSSPRQRGRQQSLPGINSRRGFAAVLSAIARNRSKELEANSCAHKLLARADVGAPFEVLQPRELVRICLRFAWANLLLSVRYHIWIGGVSYARLLHVITGVASFSKSRRRSELLRALFDNHST